MGVVLGSMYLFWIIESIMAMNGRSHGHSHGEDCESEIHGLFCHDLNIFI